MGVCMIYVTAGSSDEALAMAEAVVQERLAACANMIPSMTALYRWEGKLCKEEECILLLKTDERKKAILIQRLKQLHSYEVPCIVALPITDGHPDFLDWIHAETDAG